MDIKTVLVLDPVGQKLYDILREHGFEVNISNIYRLKKSYAWIPTFDVFVARSMSKITRKHLLDSPNVKLVANAGPFYKNIDILAAMNQKVGVINAPSSCVVSMSEYTCGLLFALSRRLLEEPYLILDRNRAMYVGSELSGKTLALLGLSDVAKNVALRMTAFGMTVIGWDPKATVEEYKQFGIKRRELGTIWSDADYIVLYTHPFENTFTYISSEMLNSCKWGVKIVTVGVIDQIQMYEWLYFLNEAMISGQVAAAAFDLYEENLEKVMSKYCVFDHPNVITSQHLGVETEEARLRGGQEVAEQLVNLVKPNTYDTKINVIVPCGNMSAQLGSNWK